MTRMRVVVTDSAFAGRPVVDMGARYIAVADVSSLQRSLRKGMASAVPFGRIVRGIERL